MKASEARKLSERFAAERNMGAIYDLIKGMAEIGKTSLSLKSKELDRIRAVILEENGYKVEEELSDNCPHDRPSRKGWIVSW